MFSVGKCLRVSATEGLIGPAGITSPMDLWSTVVLIMTPSGFTRYLSGGLKAGDSGNEGGNLSVTGLPHKVIHTQGTPW